MCSFASSSPTAQNRDAEPSSMSEVMLQTEMTRITLKRKDIAQAEVQFSTLKSFLGAGGLPGSPVVGDVEGFDRLG